MLKRNKPSPDTLKAFEKIQADLFVATILKRHYFLVC